VFAAPSSQERTSVHSCSGLLRAHALELQRSSDARQASCSEGLL
jgi:hypothetical protein